MALQSGGKFLGLAGAAAATAPGQASQTVTAPEATVTRWGNPNFGGFSRLAIAIIDNLQGIPLGMLGIVPADGFNAGGLLGMFANIAEGFFEKLAQLALEFGGKAGFVEGLEVPDLQF